jgi:hypothetical protein
MTAADTPGREEMLALADEYEAGLKKCAASGYEEYGADFQRKHQMIIDAIRLAAKPADEGVLTALVDARPYLASAFKRSQHAFDKAALEQVDDAIRALSSTGEPKRDKSYLPFWGTSEP